MPKRLLLVGLAAVVGCGSSAPNVASRLAPPAATASAAVSAHGEPQAPEDAPLALWPEVRKGTLANGLTYYILQHHKPEKRAFLWLAVNAGSVQEDDDQRGLAHFDEHMAFNGTRRFPKQDIVNYLEKIGMRFGADLNAYTTWDQTVYQLEVPTDDPSFLPRGLDILHDWSSDVSYDPVEVDKERGVVLEEWRLGRGANMRLFDKHSKVLFQGSRYADRITIGLPEIIKGAKRDTLARFYKDWYRPDLMAVIAVGDFEPAAIEKEIQTRFADLPKPSHERIRPQGGVPVATGTRVSIETDREVPATTVTVSNLLAHRPEASTRDFRRLLGEQLYTMILNERLGTIARKPDAPFIGAFDAVHSLTRDVDTFDRLAQAKDGKVEETLRALFTEVVRIERHGLSATELERARTRLARSFQEAAETEATADSRQYADEITRNYFESEMMIGRAAEKELTLQMLPTITVDELNALVGAFAGPSGRVILISGPDGAPLPSKERVAAIVDEVSKADVAAWQDKAPAQALMARPPAPGKIVKESKVDAIGVSDWTLSNGVRVIVKPTDFEVDSMTISGSSPGGEATIDNKSFGNARFAAEAAEVGGVGDFDAETLAKVLAGKQVRVSVSIDETTESIDAGGSVRDLETMLQLVHLRMTAPRKDPQTFGVWKANVAEQLSNALRSPEVQYARESQIALWKGDLRHKPPEPAEIRNIDLDQAMAFYENRFGDASDFTFVIVGAVKLDELRPLVETYLGSLPAKGRKEKQKDLGIRKVGGVVKKVWNLGQEPKALVRLDLHGDLGWTRDNERDMGILGRVLAIRLREVMREDLGGVYGVGAEGVMVRAPHQERSFSLRFGCDPARVDELLKAAFDEIAAVASKGIGADYLDKVKQTFVRQRETELRSNRFWAGWLASAYRYGDDPTIILDSNKVVERMSSDNVKAAARRFLDTKQYFEAVLLPAKP